MTQEIKETNETQVEKTDTDYAREIAQKRRSLQTSEMDRLARREEEEVKTKGQRIGERGGRTRHFTGVPPKP